MLQSEGLVLFYVFLGIFGFYSLFSSLIYFDNHKERLGKIFQIMWIAVLFVFMGCGLYFYNMPELS